MANDAGRRADVAQLIAEPAAGVLALVMEFVATAINATQGLITGKRSLTLLRDSVGTAEVLAGAQQRSCRPLLLKSSARVVSTYRSHRSAAALFPQPLGQRVRPASRIWDRTGLAYPRRVLQPRIPWQPGKPSDHRGIRRRATSLTTPCLCRLDRGHQGLRSRPPCPVGRMAGGSDALTHLNPDPPDAHNALSPTAQPEA